MPTNRGTEGESPEIRNYCRKCQGIALEVRAAAEEKTAGQSADMQLNTIPLF